MGSNVSISNDESGLIVDASKRQLTEIPSSLRGVDYRRVRALDVSYNSITAVPSLSKNDMRTLRLVGNRLGNVPAGMSSYTLLEELDLSVNMLNSESLDTSIFENFRKLVTLELWWNCLESFPASLASSLKNLQALNIAHNRITSLPAEFAMMENLTDLNISGNLLDVVPPVLARFTKLKKLDMCSNNFEEFPAKVGFVDSIQTLFLQRNRLKCLSAAILEMKNLRKLDVAFNSIRALCGSHQDVAGLKQLRELYVDRNVLVSLPGSIGKLVNLRKLDLSENRLRALPPEIGQLNLLQSLLVSLNRLEGIPKECSNMFSLQELVLSRNRLKSFPTCVASLTRLSLVDLAGNQISSIPRLVKGMKGLRQLCLAQNCLDSVPAEIFSPPVVFLNLFGNSLAQIPPKCVPSSSLRFLHLAYNQITEIPLQWGKSATSLGELSLCGNPLENVPPRLQALITQAPAERISSKMKKLDDAVSFLPELRFNINAEVAVSVTRGSFTYGFADLLGRRPQMEDAVCAEFLSPNEIGSRTSSSDTSKSRIRVVSGDVKVDDLCEMGVVGRHEIADVDSQDDFHCGVFDGHSGSAVACYAAQNFVRVLTKHFAKEIKAALSSSTPTAHPICPAHFHQACRSLNQRLFKKKLDGGSCFVFCSWIRSSSLFPSSYSRETGESASDGAPTTGIPHGVKKRVGTWSTSPRSKSHDTVSEVFVQRRRSKSEADDDLAALQVERDVEEDRRLDAEREAEQNVSFEIKGNEIVYKGSAFDRSELDMELLCSSSPRGRVFVANVGDCRAVLCRNGRAIRLSVDHKPLSRAELIRVKSLGGIVTANGRVNGILAVPRALGDFYLSPYVSEDPHVTAFDVTDDDEFMILACDGVWDVTSDQEAVDLVRDVTDPGVASELLARFAYLNNSTDNITALIVRLDTPELKDLREQRKRKSKVESDPPVVKTEFEGVKEVDEGESSPEIIVEGSGFGAGKENVDDGADAPGVPAATANSETTSPSPSSDALGGQEQAEKVKERSSRHHHHHRSSGERDRERRHKSDRDRDKDRERDGGRKHHSRDANAPRHHHRRSGEKESSERSHRSSQRSSRKQEDVDKEEHSEEKREEIPTELLSPVLVYERNEDDME